MTVGYSRSLGQASYLHEQTRGVIEITSSNSVDTNNYNAPCVFEDTREFRPVVWTKQIEDKIVEG